MIKSFAQAYRLNLILIDEKVIEKAVRFIQKHHTPDGKFGNTGIVSHKAMQVNTRLSISFLDPTVFMDSH